MSNQTRPEVALPEPWIELLRRKVDTVRFGSVEISIHEGRVTQMEVREKTRITTTEIPAKTSPVLP